MAEHYTLKELLSDGRAHQFYLTNNPANIEEVGQRLKAMGMGDEFELVGQGPVALVISPKFSKEIVIRLATEHEEPGIIRKGSSERVHRPPVPQLLQSLHTEMVNVQPPPMKPKELIPYLPTRMRIEVLPRLKTPEVGRKGYNYGTILIREFAALGYRIRDPKEQNIGLLPRRGVPVLLDPGELKPMEKKDIIAAGLSALKSRIGGYRWSFSAQTAHLKTNWKAYIAEHMAEANRFVGAGVENPRFHQNRLQPSPETLDKFR